MTVSLKSEILERLNLRKAGKAQIRGKSQKRRQMTEAAGLPVRGPKRQAIVESAPKKGDKLIYEGKTVTVASFNPDTGMAIVNRSKNSQVIVRVRDLQVPQQLNEGVLGMCPIAPTWVEPRVPTMMKLEALSPEDIGLIVEDEFTGEEDEDEDVADNGSNVRYDGHTGKKEVDELPTPSDTITPAYDADKPPKQASTPLSTEPGFSVATDPDLDGYDYPADAPEIPTADFAGDVAGNPRAPDQDGFDIGGGDGEHAEKPDTDDKEDDDRTDESYLGFDKLENRLAHKKGIRNPAAVAAGIGNKKYGKSKMHNAAAHRHPMESFNFITEIDDMLGHEDNEPKSGETITVTLPAMASILCTVAHRMGADMQEGGQDESLLKAMIEALAEVGHGSKSGCLDTPDLQAVANHINGEESQEIENREAGRPDHEGIQMDDEGEHHEPADKWPGDMEKSRTGKTKLFQSDVTESGGDYYGMSDIIAENQLSDEEEMRLIKRRAGLKFW